MNYLGIVLMYLFIGLFIGASIWAGLLSVNALFYSFCWIFCKIDSYLQDRYWQKRAIKLSQTNNIRVR